MASNRQSHPESDSDGKPRLSRRSVLAAGAAAAGTSLLGISSRRSLAQTTEQPLPTEDIPEGTGCEVCNMRVKNFPVGNTQLLLSDGERRFFCSPGCLTAYYAMPGSDEFANPADFGIEERNGMIESAWVHDYITDDNVDAFNAYYVLDNNPGNLKSGIPMGNNPVPFELRDDAEDYVGSHDLKNSEVSAINRDILQGLGKFDFELAKVFSSKFLPDSSPDPNNPFTDENGSPADRSTVIDRIVEWNNNGVIDGTQYARNEIIEYIIEWNKL